MHAMHIDPNTYHPSLIGCHAMFFVLLLIIGVPQGGPSGAIGHLQSTCSLLAVYSLCPGVGWDL